MCRYVFSGVRDNESVELIKMFLRPSEFRVDVATDAADGANGGTDAISAADAADVASAPTVHSIEVPAALAAARDKNAVKRFLYDRLSALTGKAPEWGILTGVRPVKLFGELADRNADGADGTDEARARRRFGDEYYVSDAKTELTARVYALQRTLSPPPAGAVGVYIGIPFCPTRCQYCSFSGSQVPQARRGPYLAALRREMDFVAAGMARKGMYAESVYIGGGTPTALCVSDLDELLERARRLFVGADTREFTVEAGRPDTITAEKLRVIMRRGADRISINPQSMNDATLARIGRDHTAKSVRAAFRRARAAGMPQINADLIAGLPGETAADFERSLRAVLDLAPENVTIHALAVKRAARLKEQDAEYSYEAGETAAEMTQTASRMLAETSYEPYYLYRQKQTVGNLENTGYARDGKLCLYNVRIMDERQTVVALGAGASTKRYDPAENRLTRAFNVSDYAIYAERIEEMLERKRKLLFND